MAPNTTRRSAARLIGLSVACSVAAFGVYWVFVTTARGQRWDGYRGLGVEQMGLRQAGDGLLDTINTSSLAVLGVLLALVALARRLPRLAIGTGVLIVGANATVQGMKAILSRPAFEGPLADGFNTFPSGHTAVAMSLAMAAIFVTPPALRIPAAVAGCAYAIGVGLAVIALEWHRPSDVLGAYLVVTAWAAATASVLTLWPDRTGPAADQQVARAWGLGLGVAIGAAIAILGLAASRQPDTMEIVTQRTGLLLTGVILTCLVATLVGSVVRLTGGLTGAFGTRARGR